LLALCAEHYLILLTKRGFFEKLKKQSRLTFSNWCGTNFQFPLFIYTTFICSTHISPSSLISIPSNCITTISIESHNCHHHQTPLLTPSLSYPDPHLIELHFSQPIEPITHLISHMHPHRYNSVLNFFDLFISLILLIPKSELFLNFL